MRSRWARRCHRAIEDHCPVSVVSCEEGANMSSSPSLTHGRQNRKSIRDKQTKKVYMQRRSSSSLRQKKEFPRLIPNWVRFYKCLEKQTRAKSNDESQMMTRTTGIGCIRQDPTCSATDCHRSLQPSFRLRVLHTKQIIIENFYFNIF